MKQVAHDNLNSFLGLCCNTGMEMLVLWKYSTRGNLSDFIHNEDIQMDIRFKTSFIRDVAQVILACFSEQMPTILVSAVGGVVA
jgi:hypothetical protein